MVHVDEADSTTALVRNPIPTMQKTNSIPNQPPSTRFPSDPPAARLHGAPVSMILSFIASDRASKSKVTDVAEHCCPTEFTAELSSSWKSRKLCLSARSRRARWKFNLPILTLWAWQCSPTPHPSPDWTDQNTVTSWSDESAASKIIPSTARYPSKSSTPSSQHRSSGPSKIEYKHLASKLLYCSCRRERSNRHQRSTNIRSKSRKSFHPQNSRHRP